MTRPADARLAAPSGATLPALLRLKTQRHFRSVYQRGRRAAGDWLTVIVWPRRHPTIATRPFGPRLGVSVSKENGGAVRRNKLKRLLREAFRLERHRLPATVDIVLIPRRRPDNVPLSELRAELARLVEKAMRSPARKPRRRPS